MRIRTVEISDDVAAVLRGATWTNGVLKLPPGQLERSLYVAVDKVLRALGGKWNRGQGGHVFADADRVDIEAALEQGHVVDRKRTLEQFYTPAALAHSLATSAQIELGDFVLEPSAGQGAIVEAAKRFGPWKLYAIEIDPENCRALIDQDLADNVVEADFLAFDWPNELLPTKIIMNPPFSACKDIVHVSHALDILAPGGRLVSIMSPHWTFASDTPSREFRDRIAAMDGRGVWRELPDGTFKQEGTNVSAGVLIVDKPDDEGRA